MDSARGASSGRAVPSTGLGARVSSVVAASVLATLRQIPGSALFWTRSNPKVDRLTNNAPMPGANGVLVMGKRKAEHDPERTPKEEAVARSRGRACEKAAKALDEVSGEVVVTFRLGKGEQHVLVFSSMVLAEFVRAHTPEVAELETVEA